jgi:CHAT domain-containing protein
MLAQLPASPVRRRRLEQEVERLQREHAGLLNRIRAEHDPTFDPDQPLAPIKYADMRRLIPADVPTAVVLYCMMRERSLALVLTTDGIQDVPLPDLNGLAAFHLAVDWFRGYSGTLRTPPKEGGVGRWIELLPDLLGPVARQAVQPVVDALAGRGIQRLLLVPNQALHVFPLHACRLSDGRYLADAFEVVYTPSLSILHRCAARRRTQRDRLLLIENPTLDLVFADVEGARVRRRFPHVQTLRGREATRERLLGEFTRCHVWHFDGHAVFGWDDSLDSALVLQDKRRRQLWLPLRDVFCGLHLPETQLAVISGCETGMLSPDIVDEYVGLPSGFLYAGAACVVSSLWAVSDLSTALVMDRFYQEWHSGKSIGAALREAQRWLREDIVSGPCLRNQLLTPEFLEGLNSEVRKKCLAQGDALAAAYPDRPPFGSPYHWAAFQAVGLSFPVAS